MKKERFICPYTVYDYLEELDPSDAELLRLAHEAARNAYAPYSNFNVGAAVRLANGEVVTGNNIENAAYPSGLCAERVAMFAAMAKYPNVPFEALAVTAYSASKTIDEPVAPPIIPPQHIHRSQEQTSLIRSQSVSLIYFPYNLLPHKESLFG